MLFAARTPDAGTAGPPPAAWTNRLIAVIGRSSAIWILAIAVISALATGFGFLEASAGFDRYVHQIDGRRTARETLVTLLDQEAALRGYLAAPNAATLTAYGHAREAIVASSARLEGNVRRRQTAGTADFFADLQRAAAALDGTVVRIVASGAVRRSALPAAAVADFAAERRALNALIADFGDAGAATIAATKRAILLGGIVTLLSTLLFGGVALALERMRRRANRRRTRDLETMLAERASAQAMIAAARDEALEASRLKSEFVATMSHELRTPMNGVIGMCELLLDTDLDIHQREYASVVRDSGHALLDVINDILDYSKIEAGKLELESIPFDLVATVEAVAALLAPQAREKGLALMTYVDPEIGARMAGDPGRLRQVLLNLAGNAIKFTERGSVVVSVHLAETRGETIVVRFDVKDSGIGISADLLAHLFEPFLQADGSTTRKYGGTGLGLSISRRLAELMGGTIRVESAAGVGSIFSVTVELERLPGEANVAISDDLHNVQTLIVEDDANARDVMQYYLRAWGIHSEAVADAAAGFRLLRERAAAGRPFDVAFIDYRLPLRNGLELAQQIKADAAIAGTQLVLMSAYDAPDQSASAAAGIFRFLAKPIRRSSLFDALADAVEARVPLAAATPLRDEGAMPALRTTAPRRSERLLLVEDNATNHRLAMLQLEKLGFSADSAFNGREALAAIACRPYALVFMDCQMPEMDGFTATQIVRRNEAAGKTRLPIVAMTANARPEDRAACIAAGMDDYVAKPVRLNDLRAAIERRLGAPGRHDERLENRPL